jgi:hypothetical protein
LARLLRQEPRERFNKPAGNRTNQITSGYRTCQTLKKFLAKSHQHLLRYAAEVTVITMVPFVATSSRSRPIKGLQFPR